MNEAQQVFGTADEMAPVDEEVALSTCSDLRRHGTGPHRRQPVARHQGQAARNPAVARQSRTPRRRQAPGGLLRIRRRGGRGRLERGDGQDARAAERHVARRTRRPDERLRHQSHVADVEGVGAGGEGKSRYSFIM